MGTPEPTAWVGSKGGLESVSNGNVVRHTYDALDRKTRTEDSLGLVEAASYDARGNRLTATDGEGVKPGFVLDRFTGRDWTVLSRWSHFLRVVEGAGSEGGAAVLPRAVALALDVGGGGDPPRPWWFHGRRRGSVGSREREGKAMGGTTGP